MRMVTHHRVGQASHPATRHPPRKGLGVRSTQPPNGPTEPNRLSDAPRRGRLTVSLDEIAESIGTVTTEQEQDDGVRFADGDDPAPDRDPREEYDGGWATGQ